MNKEEIEMLKNFINLGISESASEDIHKYGYLGEKVFNYINQLEGTLNEVRKECETNIRMFNSGKSYSIAVSDTSKDILKILDKRGKGGSNE